MPAFCESTHLLLIYLQSDLVFRHMEAESDIFVLICIVHIRDMVLYHWFKDVDKQTEPHIYRYVVTYIHTCIHTDIHIT